MRPRLLSGFIGAVAAVMVLTACSGDADVPDDQVLKPSDSTPSGFDESDLGVVTIAVPDDWEKQPETRPAANLVSTTWRGPVVDGIATAGVDVRVITDPQQPADRAAEALAISAMAALDAGRVEPEEVEWPDATTGAYLAYTSTVPTTTPSAGTTPSRSPELATRTLVLDLADGTQVQVTALSADSPKVPEQVLSSVVVQDD